jgi:hypothetical protein
MGAKVKATTGSIWGILRLLPKKENAAQGFPVGRQLKRVMRGLRVSGPVGVE